MKKTGATIQLVSQHLSRSECPPSVVGAACAPAVVAVAACNPSVVAAAACHPTVLG
jgi:hypothetical protein